MPQRILIYGVTGSGKSTLADRLGKRLNLPVHHVDDLCHDDGGNWKLREPDNMRATISTVLAGESWIIDGAYAVCLPIALERADLLICLDYSRTLSFWRLLRRTVRHCLSGELVCNGNRQTWRNTFARNSILIWHFQSFSRKRARMQAWAASPQPFQVVIFYRPEDADRWLSELI